MSRLAGAALAGCVILITSPADAWRRAELSPHVGSFNDGVAIVEAAAPSKAHPWGTVYAIGPAHERIDVVEWDLFRNSFVASHTLGARDQGPLVQPYDERRAPFPASRDDVVHAVRRDDRIVVVIGSRDDGAVKMLELDPDANVLSRGFLGRGRMPSLAVDDGWIVVGWYVDAGDGTTGSAFHVDVLDRRTHAVAGARVFRNGAHVVSQVDHYDAGRALAVSGGHAFVALRDETEWFVMDTKLPSLGDVHRATLPVGTEWAKWNMPHVYALGSSVVVAADQLLELTDSHEAVVSLGGKDISNLAANASGSYVLMNGEKSPSRTGTAFVLKPKPGAHQLAIAWGHPVYLRLGRGYDPDDGCIGVGP